MSKHKRQPTPHARSAPAPAAGGAYWLYGTHAVSLALANPKRRFERLLATRNAQEKLPALPPKLALESVEGEVLSRMLQEGAVHQGVAALVQPLPSPDLEEILAENAATPRPFVMLDQVTDPHNIGAIARSAAAFDVAAIILTRHHAPEENATMAKAASGGLEVVPLLYVGNLVQALGSLKKAGYWVAGLDGESKQALAEAKLDRKTVLVLGAEGKGLRRLTAEHCDFMVRLPMSGKMESLNVSNAAAIALYELYRGR